MKKTHKLSLFSGFVDLINEGGIEYASKRAKKCGFDGVELLLVATDSSEIPSIDTAKRYKTVIEAEKLSVPCVSCACSLVRDGSPSVTDMRTVEKLYKCLDFTKAIGAPLFHHTLYMEIGKPPEFKYEDAYDAVFEGAKLVADYARGLGITVIYEPQGWLFNGFDRFLKFYREIKSASENVGVCFDIGNTYWVDEEPYELLREVIDDILHVHLKDYIIGNERNLPKTLGGRSVKQVPTGRGDIKIARITGALRAKGYSAFFSTEDDNVLTPEEKFSFASRALGN